METNFVGSMRMARTFAPVLRDNGGRDVLTDPPARW
jgi:hypothetical protein